MRLWTTNPPTNSPFKQLTNKLAGRLLSSLVWLDNKRTKCPNNMGSRVEPSLLKTKDLDKENGISCPVLFVVFYYKFIITKLAN